MNADDEQTEAENHAQNKPVGGRTLSSEEIEERARRYQSSIPKFLDSDGSEIACLTEDGTIEILHSSSTDSINSHGPQSIPPDHKDYQYYWNRHNFDRPGGKNHAILKKWSGDEWIDLGDYWY